MNLVFTIFFLAIVVLLFSIPTLKKWKYSSLLHRALHNGDWSSLKKVLPYLYRLKLSLQKKQDTDLILRFCLEFVRNLPDSDLYQEFVFPILSYVTKNSFLKDNQEKILLIQIYNILITRSSRINLSRLAITFALHGYETYKKDCELRRKILAILIKCNCIYEERVTKVIQEEIATETDSILKDSLRISSGCSLETSYNEAQSIINLARFAIQVYPDEEWSYENLAISCLVLKNYDEAISVLTKSLSLRNHQKTLYLLALVLFNQSRFKDIQSIIKFKDIKEFYDCRVAILYEASEFFFSTQGKNTDIISVKEKWNDLIEKPFSESEEQLLGPAFDYLRGRILALSGRWKESIPFFKKACESSTIPIFFYYWIHLLQIAGYWNVSYQIFEKNEISNEAIQCLWLKQMLHDNNKMNQEKVQKQLECSLSKHSMVFIKYNLLTGAFVPDTLPENEDIQKYKNIFFTGREILEERLRLNLSLAINAHNWEKLEKFLEDPLFSSFPEIEKKFFYGIVTWAKKQQEKAEDILKIVVSEAEGLHGAIKCLAAIQENKGNHLESIPLLKKLISHNMYDVNSYLRLAIAYYKTNQEEVFFDFLKNLKNKKETKNIAYYLQGHLELKKIFRMIAKAVEKGEGWQEILREIEIIENIFNKIFDFLDSKWYIWLCNFFKIYITIPSLKSLPQHHWISNNKLPNSIKKQLEELESLKDNNIPKPLEIQWIEGIINVMIGDFEQAISGIESMLSLTLAYNKSTGHDMLTALWHTAQIAQKKTDYAFLAQIMEKFIPKNQDIKWKSLLISLWLRFYDGEKFNSELNTFLEEAKGRSEELPLFRAIFALQNRQFSKAWDIAQSQKNSQYAANFQIIEEICRLEGKNFSGYYKAIYKSIAPIQTFLKALPFLRLRSMEAIDILCEVLISISSEQNIANLPIPGILIYLGVEGYKNYKEKVAKTLDSLDLKIFPFHNHILFSFLQASILIGNIEKGVFWLLANPFSNTNKMEKKIIEKIDTIKCYLATRYIQEENFFKAIQILSDSY